MQHKVTIQNLNQTFLSNAGQASVDLVLKTTVENFIEPLNKEFDHTIEITHLESNNPMVAITLQPKGETNTPIGQIHFVFSKNIDEHNITAKCSNFVVAKLITPQKDNPKNFNQITQNETAFAQACENFQNTRNRLKETHPSLFITLKRMGMAFHTDFLDNMEDYDSNYPEGVSGRQKCIALLNFFATRLISITQISQKVSPGELTTRAQILKNLTEFLNLYSQGNTPNSGDITQFRRTVDQLKSAGSPAQRILFGLGMAIFGPIGIASLALIFTLIITGPIGGIALVLAGIIGTVMGIAGFLGSHIQYTRHQPKGIAAEFYLLADKMEADRTMQDQGKLVLPEKLPRDPSQAPLFAPAPPPSIETQYPEVFKALQEKSQDIEANEYERLRQGLKQVLENQPERAEEIENSINETSKSIDIRLPQLEDICEIQNLPEPKASI